MNTALLQLLEQKKQNNTAIIVFANAAYLEILENWILAMQRIAVDNFLVISLDQELHEILQRRSIVSHHLPCSSDLNNLWVKRMELFKEITDLGVNFIHSDADAVWLRDPRTEFFSDTECDIIASQGTIWPRDIHAKWGFVLCCGLFYVKNSPKMSCFLDEMLYDIQSTRDDQVSFNRIIDRDGLQWTVHEPYQLHFKDQAFSCSRQKIEGYGKHLRITVLPFHLFQRLHLPKENAYVKHILSKKTTKGTLDVLRRCGCYFPQRTTMTSSGRHCQ